jgi:NTP pyrophosphatase (non-canonical NTP hydrolase)
MKELDYICSTLPDRDLLEQLAEEAAELGQAALKLIRARGYTDNPTPVSREDAMDSLEEEFMDVLAVYAAFVGGYGGIELLMDVSKRRSKWQRWANRVRKGEEKREYQMQQD